MHVHSPSSTWGCTQGNAPGLDSCCAECRGFKVCRHEAEHIDVKEPGEHRYPAEPSSGGAISHTQGLTDGLAKAVL